MQLENEALSFRPLQRAPKLSDSVTESVLDLITRAALKPGDRLPSERDLAQQFGVSRTVVREALRSLAAKGVLDVRTGSGATVARVDAEHASEALRLYFQGAQGTEDGVTYGQVNDVREMLEPNTARLAAQEASDDDLAEIAAIHERFCATVDDPDAASLLDVAFHRAIAVSVHNPLITLILDSLEPILVEIRCRTLGLDERPKRAIEAHGLILECLRAGDPDGAEHAMREHLRDSLQVWRELEAD